MSGEVIIRVRDNGPLLVEGPARVLDAEGNEFPRDPAKPIFICRCGQTKNGPFCDGSHKQCGFVSTLRVVS